MKNATVKGIIEKLSGAGNASVRTQYLLFVCGTPASRAICRGSEDRHRRGGIPLSLGAAEKGVKEAAYFVNIRFSNPGCGFVLDKSGKYITKTIDLEEKPSRNLIGKAIKKIMAENYDMDLSISM